MASKHDLIKESYRFRYKDVPGVEDGGCHLNVYLPDNLSPDEKLPVAMMIRGGAWWMGPAYLIPFNQVRYLLDKRVVVVSIEHRLLPHCALKEIREDCLDALRYCQTRLQGALKDAGKKVSLVAGKVGVLGWSAGGLQAIYLGHDAAQHGGTPAAAVSATYPLTDLSGSENHPRSDFEQMMKAQPELQAAWDRVVQEPVSANWSPLPSGLLPGAVAGMPPPDPMPDRMALFFATLWKSNTICSYLLGEDPPFSTPSPVDVVDSNYPPTAIVIASADKSIPPEQSYKLYDRLQSKGVESRVFVCEGMEHLQAESLANAPAWPADKEKQWWDAITGNLDFVLRYLH